MNDTMEKEVTELRRFELYRAEDVSGMSGVGSVALGVVFPDGESVLRWRDKTHDGEVIHGNISVWDSLQDLQKVHGHEGRTVVRWIDED